MTYVHRYVCAHIFHKTWINHTLNVIIKLGIKVMGNEGQGPFGGGRISGLGNKLKKNYYTKM